MKGSGLLLERGSTVLQALWRQVPDGYDDHRPTTQLLPEAMEDSPFKRVRLQHPRPGAADRKWLGPRLQLVKPGSMELLLPLGSRGRNATK